MTNEKRLSLRVAPSVLRSVLDLAELELDSRRDAGADTADDTDMLDEIWDTLTRAEEKRATRQKARKACVGRRGIQD